MAESAITENLNLREVFDSLWGIYKFIEDCNEPTNSETFQIKVNSGCSKCQLAILMVNKLGLFSDNEDIEEVATNELRYMLLSAVLGYLTQKNTKEERMDVITQAKQYYIDYLRLCQNYLISESVMPDLERDTNGEGTKPSNPPPNRPPDLQAMNREREAKIRRFREQKETEHKLKELSEAVEQSSATVDEEVKRDYYLTLLKYWVHKSIEEVNSIKDEMPILEHMAKLKLNGASGDSSNHVNKSARQPQRPDDTPHVPLVEILKDHQGFDFELSTGVKSHPCRRSNKPIHPHQCELSASVISRLVSHAGHTGGADKPTRPFILTKNNLQKGVFGLGYPGVPTMTIEEFCEQKVQDGTFQLQGESMQDWANDPENTAQEIEKEDMEKEAKLEADDPVTLIRERNWDEWKDDHRRGWGNRQNMG